MEASANVSGGQMSGSTTVQPDLKSTGGPSGNQNAGPVAGGATSVQDWTTSLPDTAKLYVSQKGFKDPGAVLESYQNLEKLMGAPKERLLKLPEKADAPEWGEVYDKLGRPKAPTDYSIGAKDQKGNPITGNPEFTSWAQQQFHDLGLTKAQGEALAQRWNDYALTDISKRDQTVAQTTTTEKAALTKEWGAAYDQNSKAAFAAAKQFGLGQEEVSQLEKAIGFGKTMKFLANIGSKVGEHSYVDGGNGSGQGFQGALTPEIAKAQILELKNDTDFTQRYLAGESAAAAKMKRLMEFAYPDLPQG